MSGDGLWEQGMWCVRGVLHSTYVLHAALTGQSLSMRIILKMHFVERHKMNDKT